MTGLIFVHLAVKGEILAFCCWQNICNSVMTAQCRLSDTCLDRCYLDRSAPGHCNAIGIFGHVDIFTYSAAIISREQVNTCVQLGSTYEGAVKSLRVCTPIATTHVSFQSWDLNTLFSPNVREINYYSLLV